MRFHRISRRMLFRGRRYWPALISLLLPMAFALIILEMTMRFLLPPPGLWPTFADFFLPGFSAKVADIQGRTALAVSSSYIRVIAITAIVLSSAIISSHFRVKITIIASVAAVIIGATLGKYIGDHDVMLVNIVDNAIMAAQNNNVIPHDTMDRIHMTISVNMTVGVAGVLSLLLAFSTVAISAPLTELTASRLRGRLNKLRIVSLCGASLLVFLVVVGKTLIEWLQAVMSDPGRKMFGQLGTSAVNAWGASGSAVLLCALMPAFFSLKSDIDRAASRSNGAESGRKREWIQTNQLEFAPLTWLSTALVAAAPILTGPAIDIAGSLLR